MKFNLFFLLLALQTLQAQSVFIDGIYSDWSEDQILVEEAGNISPSQLDIERVYVTNDDLNIYFRIDLNKAIDLMDSENIAIHLDTDQNTETGFSQYGLGTELSFYLGDRFGYLNTNPNSVTVNHDAIGLTAMPTVTSDIFEVSISRTKALTLTGTIDIVITNERNNGDILPIGSYSFDEKTTFLAKPYSLTKVDEADFRIMSYNVERDGIFESFTNDRIIALLKTANPDIIAFQEIYDHSGGQVASLLNSVLPSSTGWSYITFFSDVMVFTKYQVIATNTIDGNEVSLLETPEGRQLVIVNVHLPCCDNDLSRQQEVDHIMSVIRDKEDSFKVDFEFKADTPFIITGDFNFVGEAQNITSILEGDIFYEATYGSDFAPDIDGSKLNDVNPYATGMPGNQTWYSPYGGYVGGKLDFFFYSGGGLRVENSFVLDTRGMKPEELEFYDLEENFSIEAADHLPIIADFSFGVTTGIQDSADAIAISITPNPSSGRITLTYPETIGLRYQLSNATGKIISKGKLKGVEKLIEIESKGIHHIRIIEKGGAILKTEQLVVL